MPAQIQSGTERWLEDTVAKWDAVYQPFPRQREFHESTAKYRLFGGAAGPGKSFALLMEGILMAHDWAGTNTLLLRRTFPELEQSLLLYFQRDVPRELYKAFNRSNHTVTWWNDSTTRFGYCQSESDVYQYQGAEFVFIGVDELTMFTLRQWQFLTSRNRCPVPGSFPCMAGATNPGNIGHAWVKSLWIDKKPAPGMEHPEEYQAEEYDFIKARLSDNPVYAQDEGYQKTLRALPSHLRKAFLEGDWNVFAGQYFDIWDRAAMTRRVEEIDFEGWWPWWVSVDWGFEHPACVHWHTIDDRGRTITYQEFHRNKMAPRALGQEIVERTRQWSERREGINAARGVRRAAHGGIPALAGIYLSPDAFAKRTSEQTIAEQIGEVLSGSGLPRPGPADDDRVGGWMLMYQLLRSGLWVIAEDCRELIDRIPLAVRDEKKVEDIAKFDATNGEAGDDPLDCGRYGLKSYHAPGRKPVDVRIRERLEERIGMKAEDVQPEQYTHVMMERERIEQEERAAERPLRISRRRR